MIVTPLARRIKFLRANKGITVRNLASLIGKSVAYVAKIETQGEVPSPSLLLDICKALDAEPREILSLAQDAKIENFSRSVRQEYAFAEDSHSLDSQLTASQSKDTIGEHQMAKVVSLINMKGGVGKTTLAMQLAHTAARNGLRTLAVDLDPQSNLSQALMGPRAYVDHLAEENPTIVQIFDGYVPTTSRSGSPKVLDVNEVILEKPGHWASDKLDLIPSRLELSRTLKNPAGKDRRLAKALAQVHKKYDLVIVDCAPTESVLTDAAYFASRYVIVPIKPEFMATIGLPLLARSLNEFQVENEDHRIEIAGLVFNHSSSYSSGPEGQLSINDVTKEAKRHHWHVFQNQIRYSASYAKSAREGTPLSWTSYARSKVVSGFRRFADEVFDQIGLSEVAA